MSFFLRVFNMHARIARTHRSTRIPVSIGVPRVKPDQTFCPRETPTADCLPVVVLPRGIP